MDASERAKFGPSQEVKVNLPSAVVRALENAASVFGIPLETLVAQIVTQGREPSADNDSGHKR